MIFEASKLVISSWQSWNASLKWCNTRAKYLRNVSIEKPSISNVIESADCSTTWHIMDGSLDIFRSSFFLFRFLFDSISFFVRPMISYFYHVFPSVTICDSLIRIVCGERNESKKSYANTNKCASPAANFIFDKWKKQNCDKELITENEENEAIRHEIDHDNSIANGVTLLTFKLFRTENLIQLEMLDSKFTSFLVIEAKKKKMRKISFRGLKLSHINLNSPFQLEKKITFASHTFHSLVICD